MTGIRHIPVTTEAHRRFLIRAVRERGGKFPYTYGDRDSAQDRLESMVRRELVTGNASGYILAGEGDPDAYMGTFVIRPGLIVFAFMKPIFQRQGIMTSALAQYGFDFERPTPVLVWSSSASRIAAAGYRIYPAIPEPRRPCQPSKAE